METHWARIIINKQVINDNDAFNTADFILPSAALSRRYLGMVDVDD